MKDQISNYVAWCLPIVGRVVQAGDLPGEGPGLVAYISKAAARPPHSKNIGGFARLRGRGVRDRVRASFTR